MDKTLGEAAQMLRASLLKKIETHPRYSARALARDINVSPAFISMVLSGKKKLSLDRARDISYSLQMDKSLRREFLKKVALEGIRTKSSHKLNGLFEQESIENQFLSIEEDKFSYFSHWYHVAILDLTTVKNFKNDCDWMAKKLNISPLMVKDGIDRLLRLGLLKRVGSSIKKTNNHISIQTKVPRNSLRNYHRQMIKKASEALESGAIKDFEARSITGLTMTLDPDNLAEAKDLIRDFKGKMAALMTKKKGTEVYQMNIQLFPLTKTIEDGGDL